MCDASCNHTLNDSETGYYLVDTTGYDKIIFNNGSSQTENITLESYDYPIVYHIIDGSGTVCVGYLVIKEDTCKHDYDEPVFTWTEYNATAKFTCKECSKEKVITCTVTYEVTKEATETETGIMTYTATVSFGNNTYTDTKTETIPLVGSVVTVERVEPTCETAGNIKYYISNNKYYSDLACTKEITQESTILPALGHNYGLVISGNTYTYCCKNCNEGEINIEGLKIHYDGNTSVYTDIWFWYSGQSTGQDLPISYSDSYGHYAIATPNMFGGITNLGFIVKNSSWGKDYGSDRFIDLTHLVPDNEGYYHIYLKTGSATIYTNPEQTAIYS